MAFPPCRWAIFLSCNQLTGLQEFRDCSEGAEGPGRVPSFRYWFCAAAVVPR